MRKQRFKKIMNALALTGSAFVGLTFAQAFVLHHTYEPIGRITDARFRNNNNESKNITKASARALASAFNGVAYNKRNVPITNSNNNSNSSKETLFERDVSEQQEQERTLMHSDRSNSNNKNKDVNESEKKTRKEARVTVKRKKMKIAIVGDSLSIGVGGSNERASLSLARIIAERLIELLAVRDSCEWIACGKRGASIDEISLEVIPLLKRQLMMIKEKKKMMTMNDSGQILVVEEDKEEEEDKMSDDDTVDAVIIMCGINDLKTLFVKGKMFFFEQTFEERLARLIEEIKEICGKECLIVLPGNPLHVAPLFPFPLRVVVLKLNEFFDAKKEKVCERRLPTEVVAAAETSAAAAEKEKKNANTNALFVHSPSLQALRDALRIPRTSTTKKEEEEENEKRTMTMTTTITGNDDVREGEFTARDGVHPNDAGYKAWANIIALAIASRLKVEEEEEE